MLSVLAAVQLVGLAASPRLPALHVATDADAILSCPANAALSAAVASRLPSVRLGSGRLEPEDLTARLTASEGVWRFEVRRANGAVAMGRTLPAQADCAQVADTAALILERFLAEIDWRGRPVGIEPLAQPHPEKVVVKPAPMGGEKKPGRASRAPVTKPIESASPAATADVPTPSIEPRGSGAAEPGPRPDPPSPPSRPPPRETGGAALEASGGSSGVEIVPGASGLDSSEKAIGVTRGAPAAAREGATAPPAPAPDRAPPLAAPPVQVATPTAPPAAQPDPAPVVAPAPASSATPTETAATPAIAATPGRKILSQLSLGIGGGGWLGLPTDLTASFGLEVAASLLERVRLSLLLFASSLSGHLIANNRGTIALQSFAAALTATLCGGERLTFCGGIAAGAHVTRGAVTPATASQRLYGTRADVLAVPAAGLYGRAGLGLVKGLELSLDLAALAPFPTGTFIIEGFESTPAYATPPVELIASLKLGWKFF